jgi:hypothetical protein
MRIILVGGIFFVYGVSIQNIVRTQGNTRLAMNAMLLAVGLNIILAPIFIFGFVMGVQGAALATLFAQGTASVWLLLYCIKGKGAVKFSSETLKPDLEIIKEIITVGAGSFVMESAMSIMMIFVYNALAVYGGDASIAVFGTVMKINAFILMTIMGEITLNACKKKSTPYIINALKEYEDEVKANKNEETLNKTWKGKIWLDILGAHNDSKLYIEKLLQGYTNGEITEAFVIARNDTGAEWFKNISQKVKKRA